MAVLNPKELIPEQKRERIAESAKIEWSDDKATVDYFIAHYSGEYHLKFLPVKYEFGKCRVSSGNRDVYDWNAHTSTVLEVKDLKTGETIGHRILKGGDSVERQGV